MAMAMLRLVMRTGLDEDPLLRELAAEATTNRKATSASGRSAARRARGGGEAEAGAGAGAAE